VSEGEDRGLQLERTELAWVRTALSCGALTALASRLGGASGSVVVAGCLGGAVGAMGVAAAALRIGTLRGAAPVAPPRTAAALLAVSVVAADLVVLALLFL
jgi:hypothetical protein